MLVKVKGRILKAFDGTVTDKQTGEVKTYSPSITLMDEDRLEMIKVKVSPDDFERFGHMIGTIIECEGLILKPAQAAEVQGKVTTKPVSKDVKKTA